MATLKQKAMAYTTPETRNIAELPKVSVNIDIETKNGTTNDGESFSYDYALIDNVEYRIPKSVLKQLKAHVEVNPNIEFFAVKKTGTGMQTEYTVIPVQ